MRASDRATTSRAQTSPLRAPELRRAAPVAPPRPTGIARWLGRRQPTLYHRCLAIHMHFASPRSALF